MPNYQQVGFSKNELNDIKNAMEYQIANDTSLSQSTIDRMTDTKDVVKDLRQAVADYDTANTTDTEPAVVVTSEINIF